MEMRLSRVVYVWDTMICAYIEPRLELHNTLYRNMGNCNTSNSHILAQPHNSIQHNSFITKLSIGLYIKATRDSPPLTNALNST